MSPSIVEKLKIYRALLLKWSKTINLVAPSTLSDIDSRHFNDSLQLQKYIPVSTKILMDIGSGAGFPGLILAIACPDINVHLVESDQRKCSFLSTVSRETFTPVTIHNVRIEAVDKKIQPDVITARALAKLSDLLEMTEFFWQGKPEICLIFPKGVKWKDELDEAQKLFSFSVNSYPSENEKDAAILVITDISRALSS